MGVFAILLFVPLLIQHVVVDKRYVDFEKKNKWALFAFFAILTILVAFRHESVGNDTRNYIFYFKHYAKMDNTTLGSNALESGYVIFNEVLSIFTEEPQVFLIISAIIVSILIYPTYKRLCIDPTLTIAIYCIMSTFVMMFSGIRQMIAISLGFVAYYFTRKKRIFPFILIVALAITFHRSAFMLLFMYPLFHAKITKKWLLVVVPILIVIFVFNEPIFAVLGVILEQYAGFDAAVEETGAYTMLILFAMFTAFSFIISDEKKLDKEIIGIRNFLLFAVVIQMFAPLNALAMRMSYYYIIFIPLLIPKIIEAKSDTWKQVAVFARHIMIIFFFFYFFMTIGNDGHLNVSPYHFFWEKV